MMINQNRMPFQRRNESSIHSTYWIQGEKWQYFPKAFSEIELN